MIVGYGADLLSTRWHAFLSFMQRSLSLNLPVNLSCNADVVEQLAVSLSLALSVVCLSLCNCDNTSVD